MKLQEKKLKKLIAEFDVHMYDLIDSTNTVAKGKTLYTLVVANSQSGGRGRAGKSFFSPKGGIYMSLVMPRKDIETIRVAVSVCRSLDIHSKDNVAVKWVNDIFSKGKKVAGILSETADGKVVLGIGINISRRKFPEEIADIAGSVTIDACREALIATIARETVSVWGMPKEDVIAEYKRRLFMLGKRVEYTKNGEKHSAVAENINEDGNLIVSEDGEIDILNAGEISLGSDNFTD